MTDIENNIENPQEEIIDTVEETAIVDDIFDDGVSDKEDKVAKEVEIEVKEDDKTTEPKDKVKEEVIEKPVEVDYDKLQKSLKETQSWGHSKSREAKEYSQRLEAAEAKIQEYVESGAVTPEEGDAVLRHTAHNRPEEVVVPLTESEEVGAILDKTFSEVVKYSSDPDTIKYGESFRHLTDSMTPEELTRLTNDLSRVKKDPVLMTKTAIDIGKQYYNDFYKDYQEAGGTHGLANNYKNKITELQKTIDMQQKDIVKLKHNSDYTSTSGYSLPAGITSKAPATEKTTSSDSFDIF